MTTAIVLAKVPSVISDAARAKRLLRNIGFLPVCPAELPGQEEMYRGLPPLSCEPCGNWLIQNLSRIPDFERLMRVFVRREKLC